MEANLNFLTVFVSIHNVDRFVAVDHKSVYCEYCHFLEKKKYSFIQKFLYCIEAFLVALYKNF